MKICQFRRHGFCAVVVLLFLCSVGSKAQAGVIGIDMDPLTPGIQTSFSVTTGDSFGIDIVYVGDGATLFDAFTVSVVYGTPASVIDTGIRLAGSIAGDAASVLDLGSGLVLPPIPGTPLTPFGGSSVGLGGNSFPFVPPLFPFFPAVFSGGPYLPPVLGDYSTILVSIPLTAGSVGMSTVTLDPIVTGLIFTFGPSPFSLAGGSLTVTPSSPGGGVIPEPTSGLIWSGLAGILGFVSSRRRRFNG